MCIEYPIHGHGVLAVHVAIDNGWFDAAAAIALHPSILCKAKSAKLLAEVLHHVITLSFAVHKHIQAKLFLFLNACLDFSSDSEDILRLSNFAFCEIMANLADIGSLRKRADCGCRQEWQIKPSLRYLALWIGRFAFKIIVCYR